MYDIYKHMFGVFFMKLTQQMSLTEKLQILSDAAKYDVACTSSGSDRRGTRDGIHAGQAVALGIPELRESVIPSVRMGDASPF